MEALKIILFLCNWGPHAAFQTLLDDGSEIPPEVRMVRIPCSGRITKSLLFKAFEMGADGVALVGCEPGTCRYGKGADLPRLRVEDVRDILEMLGLGKERLRWGTFLPEQSASLLSFLWEFTQAVRKLGKSPVTPKPKIAVGPVPREQTIRKVVFHDVHACQDCGKCTSACPLALVGKPFSPRAVANAVVSGSSNPDSVAGDVWACLTCGLCYDRCPSAVNFPDFIRELREVYHDCGQSGHEPHDGFFHALMRTMTSPGLEVRHWDWLPKELGVDPKGKLLFFGGCAPYFDIFFRRHMPIHTRDILLDSIRLLNFFDITPRLLAQERCCGHDLLWSGDKADFLDLARLNARAIRESGIEEIVTSCPECYRTLSEDYPKHGIDLGCTVIHLHDLLEREIDKGAVGFEPLHRRITYQDPCRLSRMENPTDASRKLIHRLQSQGFVEMKDRGASSLCCGNCAWTTCDSYNKAMQLKRLEQARDTGSDLLITSCPKCQVHLTCAMEGPFLEEGLKIELADLASVLAKTIRWE